jgi:hypothetical protein
MYVLEGTSAAGLHKRSNNTAFHSTRMSEWIRVHATRYPSQMNGCDRGICVVGFDLRTHHCDMVIEITSASGSAIDVVKL